MKILREFLYNFFDVNHFPSSNHKSCHLKYITFTALTSSSKTVQKTKIVGF